MAHRRPAEEAALARDGMQWAAGAIRLPFTATISVWRETRSAVTSADQQQRPQHLETIEADRRHTFDRRSTFLRFAPVMVRGEVGGDAPPSAAMIRSLDGQGT